MLHGQSAAVWLPLNRKLLKNAKVYAFVAVIDRVSAVHLRSSERKERPSLLFPPGLREVKITGDKLLLIIRLQDCPALWIDDKRLPGEVHAAFLSDTVAHGDEGHVLICLHAHFLLEHLKRLSLGVGSRHNDKICPERGAGPDALGKVAVKADDDADFPEVGLIDPESVIRGRGTRKAPELSLLIVQNCREMPMSARFAGPQPMQNCLSQY